MMDTYKPSDLSETAFAVPVMPAAAFRVVAGANLDDPLSFADDLIHDDTYALGRNAATRRLSLVPEGPARFRVALDSVAGQPGALVHLDSSLTFMSQDGETTEILVLVEVDAAGDVTEVHALPLVPLQPKLRYTL
ncbi:MAG TPA: hypothetical protein VLA45_05040, partial [Paracoccaceae bacterium]|nr:hypothetical protein [Paracoccaceae bacterium]